MTSQALTAFGQPTFLSKLHILAKFHPKCTPATCVGSEASQELLLLAANSGNAQGSVGAYEHCPCSKRLQMPLVGVPFTYSKSFQAFTVEPSFSPECMWYISEPYYSPCDTHVVKAYCGTLDTNALLFFSKAPQAALTAKQQYVLYMHG